LQPFTQSISQQHPYMDSGMLGQNLQTEISRNTVESTAKHRYEKRQRSV
jgi:hypothetical protein